MMSGDEHVLYSFEEFHPIGGSYGQVLLKGLSNGASKVAMVSTNIKTKKIFPNFFFFKKYYYKVKFGYVVAQTFYYFITFVSDRCCIWKGAYLLYSKTSILDPG